MICPLPISQVVFGINISEDNSKRNSMQVIEEKQDTRCMRCTYTWETKSKLMWVTCPSCRRPTLAGRNDGVGGHIESNK
jgi:Zn finger protein HypA/HybF involved in hydrogenase expression